MSRVWRVVKWGMATLDGLLLLALGLALAFVVWVGTRSPHEPPQWRRAFEISARAADFPAIEVADPTGS